MTLPAFKAIGTGSETAPAWPTHASGDFALLFTETDSGSMSAPSGWTTVMGSPVTNASGNNTVLQVFYRFATSSSETAPSISGSDHAWGVIITFTGVNTSNPIHTVSKQILGSTTALRAVPGLTTYIDDCMIVAAMSWHLDNAGPLSSGEANPSLANVTERYDAGTTTANGGGLVIITGELATAGTIQPTTTTFSTGSALALMCIALQAADRTFANQSRVINTGM